MWELDPEWNIAKSSLAALPNLIPCVPSGKAIAPFDLMVNCVVSFAAELTEPVVTLLITSDSPDLKLLIECPQNEPPAS